MKQRQPDKATGRGKAHGTSAPAAGRSEGVQALVEAVYARIGNPVDALAVTATLERLGWRDLDARDAFGHPDLFVLGEEVYRRCKERARREAQAAQHAPAARGHLDDESARAFGRFLRHYGRGLLFVMPVVGQVVAILFLGYSLWAWLHFSEAQATVVALGTLFSFVVTGGFVQSIGREGTRYLSLGDGAAAQQACYSLVRLGSLAVLGIAAGAFVLNLLLPFFPMRLMLVSLMYFVLLSELWLLLSILYVIEHLVAPFLITLLGIAPVYGVMALTDWGIYAAHGLGLTCAVLVAAVYGHVWMRRGARNTGAVRTSPPPRSVQIHGILPYFAYGVLYFSFLFVDRVIAWSVTVGEPPPYFIWFRTPYELGIDWALISLLLTIAILQTTIHAFSRRQIPAQQSTAATRFGDYNALFRRFYRRQLIGLLVAGGLSIAATFFGAILLRQIGVLEMINEFRIDHVTPVVFWWAAAGYLLVAIGLLNALFFFTLGRPGLVLRAMGPALGVNIVVGFLASRWISYEYAVLGLVAGAAVFALLSMRHARRFFQRLDYYYYSSY